MKHKSQHGGRQKQTASRADRWRDEKKKPNGREAFISGINGVKESLASPHVHVKKLWVDAKKLTPFGYEVVKPFQKIICDTKVEPCPYGDVQQGMAALVDLPTWPSLEEFAESHNQSAPLWVVLDQIEDPMNLGQILRTCEGAGVTAVILPERRSVQMTQTVAQVSQGAFAWMPVLPITNLRWALEILKEQGAWIIGCEFSPEARLWDELSWTGPTALVMGAEGSGLRDLTRRTCDHLAYLPMLGKIDSLNVGAALSAFLYEACRQRLKSKY